MRKTLMITPILTLGALALGAATLGTAHAQSEASAPPPSAGVAVSPTEPADTGNPPAPPGPDNAARRMRMGGGWHHHDKFGRDFGRPGWHGRPMPFAPGTFALFARQPDKHLSASDVGEIARAILLWHGQHDWKVSGVEAGPDHTVSFAYTAPDGTVIAKFAIDQATGRISRQD